MRLATPAFKNRKAAIFWMLILASSLIAVDYFLGEPIVNSYWSVKKQKIEDLQHLKAINSNQFHQSSQSCQQTILSKVYTFSINKEQKLELNNQVLIDDFKTQSVLCTRKYIYLLSQSNYNAALYQIKLTSENDFFKQKIISKLNHIEEFYLINDSIYLAEISKNRLLALSNIVSSESR